MANQDYEKTIEIEPKYLLAYVYLQRIYQEKLYDFQNSYSTAKKMNTSRSAVDRLFDPENESITLQTLNKAASVLGKKLKIELM